MNAMKNKVQLIGHLCAAPEVKNMEKGKKLAVFTIATDESYRNSTGQKVMEKQWHRLIAWGKIAAIVEKHFCKGKLVAIEGRLSNRQYTDGQGMKRYITEIQATEILMFTDNY